MSRLPRRLRDTVLRSLSGPYMVVRAKVWRYPKRHAFWAYLSDTSDDSGKNRKAR